MIIAPKNWQEFQHYKDRSPAWVKLHRSILDDYEFHCLPIASRALAPMLWLVASEDQSGHIDADSKKIAFRLRMTPKDVEAALNPLIEAGFFFVVQGDSDPLAEGKRGACLEEERETEEEKRKNLCAEPQGDSAPEPAIVISLTLNDKSEFPVTEEQVSEWSELFPAVDVLQSLRAMKAWCDANPSKRKTVKGVRKFITGWLTRDQDRGGNKRETETGQPERQWHESASGIRTKAESLGLPVADDEPVPLLLQRVEREMQRRATA